MVKKVNQFPSSYKILCDRK